MTTFSQPTKNTITFSDGTKSAVVSFTNPTKSSSSTVTSYLLTQSGFSLLLQSGGHILLDSTVPGGSGYTNFPKSS